MKVRKHKSVDPGLVAHVNDYNKQDSKPHRLQKFQHLRSDARSLVLDFIYGLLILLFAVFMNGRVAFIAVFWGALIVGSLLILSSIHRFSKVC
ncbi:MAG: hypothetical protein OEX02_13615 [Cyclobacteriaceae bacterium]|nr:hypothetical protein [Cyclobacteriaceae bacterium]